MSVFRTHTGIYTLNTQTNSLYLFVFFSQIFSMDIMRHKDAVDEIVKMGKAIMNSKSPEEKEVLMVRRNP